MVACFTADTHIFKEYVTISKVPVRILFSICLFFKLIMTAESDMILLSTQIREIHGKSGKI